MAHIRKFSSGMHRTKGSRQLVRDFMNDNVTVELSNGKVYGSIGLLNSNRLKKGDIALASYNQYNQGADLVEILGFTDMDEKYGDGGVKFDSIEEIFKKTNTHSLAELEKYANENQKEYGHGFYMVVKDLEDGDSGAWFYLSDGHWVRGSGAEKLTFTGAHEVRGVNESLNKLSFKNFLKEFVEK